MEEKNVVLDNAKQVKEFIRDTFNDSRIGSVNVSDARYHHNADFPRTPSVVRNGILSLSELNRLGIRKFTKEELDRFSDTSSHINGIDFVSLAVVGLTDLYRDEEEYDPFMTSKVDINIASSVVARRNARHYGNEFLAERLVRPEDFRAIDIRLIKLMERINLNNAIGNKDVEDLILYFNTLKEIATSIKESKGDILLREMSDENMTLDIDKVSNYPNIGMKR